MPIFLGIHKLPSELTAPEVEEGYAKYKANATAKGLKPLSAIYSKDKGFAHCQTEAENADQVRQAHEGAAIPLEDVVEVKSIQ